MKRTLLPFLSALGSKITSFKNLSCLVVVLLLSGGAWGQSSANYAFSTGTSSLNSMTGSTIIVTGVQDTWASATLPIGFNFIYMGSYYSHFSVNSNGQVRLHNNAAATPISSTSVSSYSASTVTLAPMAGDNETGNNISYIVTGTSPNRKLIIEWNNFYASYFDPVNSGNIQLVLNEGTGEFQFLYGNILNSSTTTDSKSIFHSSSNTANASSFITVGATPTQNTTATSPTTNAFAASVLIANLANTFYKFTPPTPAAGPTVLTFTSVTPIATTLNWTAASPTTNSIKYSIYNSTNGGTTYNFVANVAVGTNTYVATGLTPSTSYTWKVVAVSEGVESASAATDTQATTAPGTVTAIASGNWSATATWSSGTIPTASDNVIIPTGLTVTEDVTAAVAYSLSVSGNLIYTATTARTLTVTSDLTINSGGTFKSAATGTIITHSLVLSGNLINNGTIDFSTATNAAGATISFTGAISANFTLGSGSVTNLRNTSGITLNKGTSISSVLTFTPGGTLTVQGANALGFLTITNGYFKVDGSTAFSNPLFNSTGYTVPATGGIWMNNPNATILGLGGSPTMSGLLRMSAGTYNVGSASGNSMGGAATSSFIIEGGTMNFSGRLNVTSAGALFNMSAGTINITTIGNASSATAGFGFTSPTSVFTMSGGTINLVQRNTGATILDYQVSTTSPTITGGTLNIGTASTATNFNFGIQGALPNVVIDNNTNAKTATLTAAATAYGTTTINSGATLNLNGFTYQERAATLTNNGTITGSTTSSRLSFFSPTSVAQTFAGSGIVTAALDGLSVQNTSGLTISHTNTIPTLRVNLFAGTITNSNKIILGNAAATITNVQIGASGSTTAGGSFDVAPTFNLGSGGYNVLYLSETSARTTGLEIPATRTVTAITVANNNGVTLAGGNLAIGTLTLSGGTFTTSSSNIATVTGTTITSVVRNTATLASASSVGTTVTVTSTTGLSAGMIVTVTAGTGSFAANTTVVSVVNSTTFTVSAAPTTALSAATVAGIGGWVNGPLELTLPASLVSGSTYLFPIGKTALYPFELVNPTTTAGGSVVVRAEVFDGNSGGTPGNVMASISTSRYWGTSISSGGANLTNTNIRLSDASTTGFDAIANSASVNGAYDIIGGTTSTVTGTTIQTLTPLTSLSGYYVMGSKAAATLATPSITPTGNQCTNVSRAISVQITPGGGAVSSVNLNYSINGSAQTAIAMTNTTNNGGLSADTWTATLPTVTPVNAAITWSITATDANSLSRSITGPGYQDAPNTGITATATASPSTVCDGSNASLSASLTPSFYFNEGFEGATFPPTNWTLLNGGTGNYWASGTSYVCSGTKSMQYSYNSSNAANTWMITPVQNLIAGNTYYISFNYKSYGSTTSPEKLKVTVGTSNTIIAQTSTLLDLPSISNSACNTASITYTPSVSGTYYFGFNCYTPSNFWSLGVDDITISSIQGSAPTPSSYSWSNGTTTLGTTNPLSTPIASGLTYTATATVNGCPMTAAVTPTVNSLPTAPTATNSSQCGAGIPTASVADNNSYTTPTFKWYSAASGGTALQTSTSTTYTTSINATTTFYVAVVGTNTCESARTAVTVTVTQPDAISATTSAAAICLGRSVTLTAANTASTPTQNYTYSWICATTGSGATSANTNNPASITPSAAGSYIYTVTGTDGACSAVNTVAVTVNALPNITSATASPSSVCSGSSVSLSAASISASSGTSSIGTGTTAEFTYSIFRHGYGNGDYRHQLLYSASELTAAGLVAGQLTSIAFNITTLGSTAYTNYNISLANVSASSVSTTFNTSTTTQVYLATAFTLASGVNTFNFGTGAGSSSFTWDGTSSILVNICYTVSGASSTSYVQSSTTSFVSNNQLLGSAGACSATTATGTSTSRPNATFGGQIGTNNTVNFSWSWNSTPAISTASGSTTETNTGASATSKTYTVTATNATTGCTNTATTSAVTINPAPVAPTATNSTQCGSGTPTCSVTGTGTVGNTFKWYTVSTGGTALVGQSGSTLSSYPIAANTTFYVSESNGTCESARTQVDVTVTTPPAITASASLSTVCSGSPTVLSVTSANSGYTYAWSNSLGSGASVSASPTSNTTYTVTATDSSGGANNGCVTTATVAITSNDLPSAITFSPANANICTGSSQSIVASGGTNTTAIFNENFEVSANSFTAQNGSTAVVNSTYYSQGASSVLFNTSATTATKKLTLNSNIDLTNCSSATLTFSHIAAMEGSSTTYDYGFIEYSIDGGTSWVVFPSTSYVGSASNSLFSGTDVRFSTKSYTDWTSTLTSNTATPTNSLWKTEQFNIPLSALTNQFKFRFSYYVDSGTFYYGWLIDNISINKNITNITWSPTTDLYTDAATSTAYTGNPTTVYAKPTTNTTYTATATNAAGCSSSNTVTVTVSPTSVAGSVSANQAICAGNSPSDITLSGNTGNIQWQVSTNNSTFTAISGATAATLTSAQMGTLTATRYYRAVVTSGVCTAANSSVVTVTVNSLPTTPVLTGSSTCSGSTGSITSSTSETGVNYQLYDSSNATVGTSVSGTGSALSWSSIAIGNGYYAKATNATTNCISTNSNAVNVGTITTKTWTANSGNWSDQNNWSCGTPPSSSDVIVISSGSPVLDTNFTVGAAGSLTISGTGTLTINPTSTLTIAGTANFGGKAVTIKSNATGNGAIGQVTGTLSGATNVTVERYIPAKRSWRAITAPVTMATSINANWQEGGTGNSTNGFDIWDPNGGTGIITGGIGSSLLEYSSSANNWAGITNTTATSTMIDGSVNKPFMAFVTGPYGANNVNSGAAVTTLRATGTLLTGDKTYATTANKYAFIGNPYASPLDLTAMLNNTSNATASFGGNVWVWDANVLGTYSVGTYNLFDFAASNYSNTSNNANISGAQIQSGQAFFVKSTDGATFTIKEAHKGSVFTNAVFRSGAPEILRANLYKQVNNEWAGRDGAMTVILSDAAANQAPNKMANGSENIAFTKNGALFASNHHLPLVANDVLNVKVWNTTAGANYKLKFNTEAFTATNLIATLEDLFTNSRTPLNLEGAAVEYPFTVTTDALSSGDRFRIVFQNAVLGTNNPTANGFQIVPNPVTGDSFQVNLGTLATGTYSYSICNAIGQEVEKGSIQNATQNTNYTVKFKENAATGIYIMKIKGSDNSVFTAKIIKK